MIKADYNANDKSITSIISDKKEDKTDNNITDNKDDNNSNNSIDKK